jgi:hypothetical protein
MYKSISQSYNPIFAETNMVWAVSVSLAATQEITLVFSSSGYLDVSVLRVCAIAIHLQCIRLPHSEIYGSTCICQSP